MICSNCNTQNHNESKFCIGCGQPLITNNINNEQPINNNIASQPFKTSQHQYNTSNVSMNNETQKYSGTNYNYNNLSQNSSSHSNKKTIFIILGLLLIVGIIGFSLFKFVFNNGVSEAEILNKIFDHKKPIVIEKNDKYGYITSEGRVMIEPQYKYASEFVGDYAIVSIDNPDSSSYIKDLYQIIDKKGNPKFTEEIYSAPKYYAEYDVWVINGILYNSKLNKILEDGITVEYISNGYFEYSDITKNKSGIMNHEGKKIFTWVGTYIYADISDNEYSEELYARVKGSDNEQDLVISLKTGKILYTVSNPEENHIYVKDNNIFRESNSDYNDKKWLFFIDNKLAYSTSENIYDLEIYDYQNKILEIDYGYNYDDAGKEQRYYYYDIKSKKTLTEKPTKSSSDVDLEVDLMELLYGYKQFSSSGKYGLMKEDKVILPCEYDDIEFVNERLYKFIKNKKNKELVLLEKDDSTVLMNLKNQKIITTFDSSYVSDYSDSTFLQASIYDDNYNRTGYLIYNVLTGESMTIDKDDKINIESNYIIVTKNNKKTYYNTKLKQIYIVEE